MTVRSNQSSGCASANRLTSVGFAAGSIGPPINIIDAGWQASPAAASSDTAASTGTEGWHTAMTCVCGPSRRMKRITRSTKSSRPNRPKRSGTFRAFTQSVMKTSWSQQGLDGAAQQGREVARERGNDQDDRLFARPILTEMEQVAKRIGGDDLLGHSNRFTLDRYCPDAEIGPVMRHAGVGQQLHRGRSAANTWRIPDQRPRVVEKTPESLGHQPNRTEYVVVYLIGLVQHKSSYVHRPAGTPALLYNRRQMGIWGFFGGRQSAGLSVAEQPLRREPREPQAPR